MNENKKNDYPGNQNEINEIISKEYFGKKGSKNNFKNPLPDSASPILPRSILLEEKRHFMRLQTELESLRLQNADLSARVTQANFTIGAANLRIESLKRENADLRMERRPGIQNKNFAVLGLDPNTAFLGLTEEQIQAVLLSAYRARAKIYHPDHQDGSEKRTGETMKSINLAYDQLKDPSRRGPFLR